MYPRRSSLKIVYFGTAAIGIPLLRRCSSFGEVVGVLTAPPRHKGRGRKLESSPIKEEALRLNLPLHQPEDVNSSQSLAWLRNRHPDTFILFAYGQILSAELLTIPRYALNVHPSLLPKYRGAAPIRRAIMAGEEETGITVIQMSEKVDAGGILASTKIPIDEEDTYGEIAQQVSRAAPYLVENALLGLEDGTLTPQPQSEQRATPAPKIRREERLIRWEEPVWKVHNLVRAFSPEPLAYTLFRGRRLELIRTRVADEEGGDTPGRLALDEGHLVVQCGMGFLEILSLKPEGKGEMDAQAFVNGYRPKPTDILGS